MTLKTLIQNLLAMESRGFGDLPVLMNLGSAGPYRHITSGDIAKVNDSGKPQQVLILNSNVGEPDARIN